MGRASRTTQIKRLTAGAMRYPRTIRHLPRLVRSYGHSTLELRQPWLPFDVIDVLRARLAKGARVFEYGGGGSTAWFADLVGRNGMVVSVEHDQTWGAALATALRDEPNVELLQIRPGDDFTNYVSAIDSYPDEHFDVIVVDGRQRVRCFERAIPHVKPGGVLLLDDVDRPRYEPTFGMVDWPRQVFHGYAPCKDDVAHTALFTRPR